MGCVGNVLDLLPTIVGQAIDRVLKGRNDVVAVSVISMPAAESAFPISDFNDQVVEVVQGDQAVSFVGTETLFDTFKRVALC